MEPDAPLGRAAGHVVLDPVALEDLDPAVVHAHRELHLRGAPRLLDHHDLVRRQVQDPRGGVELRQRVVEGADRLHPGSRGDLRGQGFASIRSGPPIETPPRRPPKTNREWGEGPCLETAARLSPHRRPQDPESGPGPGPSPRTVPPVRRGGPLRPGGIRRGRSGGRPPWGPSPSPRPCRGVRT